MMRCRMYRYRRQTRSNNKTKRSCEGALLNETRILHFFCEFLIKYFRPPCFYFRLSYTEEKRCVFPEIFPDSEVFYDNESKVQ